MSSSSSLTQYFSIEQMMNMISQVSKVSKIIRRKRSESEHDEKHRTWHLAKTKCQFLCATQHFVSKKRYEVLGAMLSLSCVVITLSTLQQTNAKLARSIAKCKV